jgi:hypothetical protein
MTRVQIHYDLQRSLDEDAIRRLESARGIYGMGRIVPAPDLGGVEVEYDASRLTAADVEAVLRRLGVPIVAAA